MIVEKPSYHDLTGDERDRLKSEMFYDWHAAREHRREREDRALTDYLLYKREESTAEDARLDRRGWSRVKSPLIYWTIETLVPRVVVNPPTITVTPMTAEATPYATAKQMRLQHYLRMGNWHKRLIRGVKQMYILGDSPVKIPYVRKHARPEFLTIPWWDFFLSPEAMEYESAEAIWHRTFYTYRQLAEMAKQVDEQDRPLWSNLEFIPPTRRDQVDPTWAARREASGNGDADQEGERPLYSVIEGWFADGTYVALGGEDGEQLLRCGQSPYVDRKGNYIRPFAMLGNTPDIVGPYSLSIAQLLEDHQIELETVRNAHIDQINGNLNAPVAHMDDVDSAIVDEAFSTPNGRLPIPSSKYARWSDAVGRMPPGQATDDFMQLREEIRSEAQMASGVSDISAGQMSAEGISNQTATGMSIITGEVNRRVQLVMMLTELEMGAVARIMDCHDRQFGGALEVPVRPGFQIQDQARGIDIDPTGRTAKIGMEANGDDMDYFVMVDAGSLARTDQLQQSQQLLAFTGTISQIPQLAEQVKWDEMLRKLALVHEMPEGIIKTPEEVAQERAMQALAMQQAQIQQQIEAQTTAQAATDAANAPENQAPNGELQGQNGAAAIAGPQTP